MKELDDGWQEIVGTNPILLVAAHNFPQGRNGLIKPSDLNTGTVARNFAEKYNLFALISTRKQIDPNWYPSSNFREKVKEIIKNNNIKLVIDIHGKSLSSPLLVEFIANKSFQNKYSFSTRDFINSSQLNLVEELDLITPAVEIEIREDGRVSTIDEVKYKEAQKIIDDFIKKII